MLFDCDEYFMKTRLLQRGKDSGRIDDNMAAIGNRVNFYKYNTLPVMKHFEDNGKLVVVSEKFLNNNYIQELFHKTTINLKSSQITCWPTKLNKMHDLNKRNNFFLLFYF